MALSHAGKDNSSQDVSVGLSGFCSHKDDKEQQLTRAQCYATISEVEDKCIRHKQPSYKDCLTLKSVSHYCLERVLQRSVMPERWNSLIVNDCLVHAFMNWHVKHWHIVECLNWLNIIARLERRL